MVRHKRRVAFLSGDSLKSISMAAGLVVTLYQGWAAGRRAEGADARAGAVAAYAVNVAGQRDSLAVRVGNLERAVGRLRVIARRNPGRITYGPEPAPADYRPESRGILWHLKHPFGR